MHSKKNNQHGEKVTFNLFLIIYVKLKKKSILQDGRKFANHHISDRGLIFKTSEELIELNINKRKRKEQREEEERGAGGREGARWGRGQEEKKKKKKEGKIQLNSGSGSA